MHWSYGTDSTAQMYVQSFDPRREREGPFNLAIFNYAWDPDKGQTEYELRIRLSCRTLAEAFTLGERMAALLFEDP